MNNSTGFQPGSPESGIVQRVRKSLREFATGRPQVLLACSGGRDSVALASILASLARLEVLSLTVVHIHHGQHDQADDAAAAVRHIGEVLGIPVVVRHLSAESVASHSGLGLEEALRRERYLSLADVAREMHAGCIALAHHQTDQAETLLLHLLRGTGVDGLAGMRSWEHRSIPWWELASSTSVTLWRPFLHESASSVAELARMSGLPIIEDPTNADTAFRRNAVRHQVLPLLEEISPGSTGAIARSAEVIALDAALLAADTDDRLADCMSNGALSRSALAGLPEGWQHRVVRRWLMNAAIPADITYDRVSAVVELAQRNRGGNRVEVGAGTTVILQGGMLILDSWQNRDH